MEKHKHGIRHVILMDFSWGGIIKIRLSDEQMKESENYENFEEYLETIEREYGFRMKDSYWMGSKNVIKEETYGY